MVGGGVYNFIPDTSILGTAFVNSISNHRVTFGRNAHLQLEPLNDAKLGVMPAGLEFKNEGNGGKISVSTLQLGQKRDYIFPMEIQDISQPFLKATLIYNAGEAKMYSTTVEGVDALDGNTMEVRVYSSTTRLIQR